MALITCPDCNKEVSENAPTCPNCGSPLKTTPPPNASPLPAKNKSGWGKRIGIALLVFFILAGIISALQDKGGQSTSTATASKPASASSSSSTPQKSDLRPESQIQFEAIVAEFAKKFRGAKNEIQESTARRERAQAVANLQIGLNINEWIGTLTTIGTNSDGNAYITVQLNRNLMLVNPRLCRGTRKV